MLLDRSRRDTSYLEWRVRLLALGAVFGVGGIALDARWATGSALALLLAGVTLRFAGRRSRGSADSDAANSDSGEQGAGEQREE